jgi:hypothetical protein
MGRPLKPIDAEQVYRLARLGCTQQEIADFFGCHPDTIRDRFSTELARARAAWKMSIRRAQTVRAIRDRSDTMLIHLGKTELGQTAQAGDAGVPDEDWLGDDDGNPVEG